MVYKFPQMSRKEIAGMLGVDDKQANAVLSGSVYRRKTGREIRGSGRNAINPCGKCLTPYNFLEALHDKESERQYQVADVLTISRTHFL